MHSVLFGVLSSIITGLWVHEAFYVLEPNLCNDPPDHDTFHMLHREAHYRLLEFVPSIEPGAHAEALLFVHGHGGSHSQGRTLASMLERNGAAVHFYAVDFREEWCALSASTLWRQTRFVRDAVNFILKSNAGLRRVGLVAHSMGGVVAQAAFLMDGFESSAIPFILTLGTPHRAAPFPLNTEMSELYHALHKARTEPNGKLTKVAVISITGGERDVMIRSDLSRLEPEMIEQGRGLFVRTVQIPGLLHPVDHVCLVWCEQLLVVLTKFLQVALDRRALQPSEYIQAAQLHLVHMGSLPGLQQDHFEQCTEVRPLEELENTGLFLFKFQSRLAACFSAKVPTAAMLVASTSAPFQSVYGITHNGSVLNLHQHVELIQPLPGRAQCVIILREVSHLESIQFRIGQSEWVDGSFGNARDLELLLEPQLEWHKWWEVASVSIPATHAPLVKITMPPIHNLLSIGITASSASQAHSLDPPAMISPQSSIQHQAVDTLRFGLRQSVDPHTSWPALVLKATSKPYKLTITV
eukprot:TRINITY_DN16374_c0_g2_i1.p1 TRINITY_DN16374_c0_g2~~TRINITY_DN16374_c0_g2_i1.p1  ORF type:complete len:525 (-),score=43.72 TRINITY_DN16374_c0_g2_i1:1187-2761(-)